MTDIRPFMETDLQQVIWGPGRTSPQGSRALLSPIAADLKVWLLFIESPAPQRAITAKGPQFLALRCQGFEWLPHLPLVGPGPIDYNI